MDAQLKRGFYDVCVLTAIHQEDSYGYKIIKDISPYMEISESTLYPILKRLENADCLAVYNVEHNSRLRKYYKITQSGKDRIKEFLEEWDDIVKVYEFVKEAGVENE